VYFEVMPADREAEPPSRLTGGILLPLQLILLPGAVLLAIRNHHRGRGDMRGAVRLGAAILTVDIGAWLIGGHHSVSDVGGGTWPCAWVSGGGRHCPWAWATWQSSRPSGGGGRGGSPPGTGCWTAGSATRWWGGIYSSGWLSGPRCCSSTGRNGWRQQGPASHRRRPSWGSAPLRSRSPGRRRRRSSCSPSYSSRFSSP